jgi:signal transduction histidine kinase
MKSRSAFALIVGFSILIVLIAILGFGAVRRVRTIYQEMETAQESYLGTEAFRRGIANDMYLADVLVRDYLLDPSLENAPLHRQELLATRNSLQERLDLLSRRMREADSPSFRRLQEEVEGYWDSLDPIFEWTVAEKAQRGSVFLRRNVLPRRQAVVNLAREMARINDENLEKERQRLQASQQVLQEFLFRMIAFTLGLGIMVAVLTTSRVVVLERRHEEQRKQIEQTQNNLRRLSRRLVQAQELERRALSRELHDEVGQTMTALGIELGNLEKTLRNIDGEAFRACIEDAKRLNTKAMRAIRDLAMGLRPSMLDDLGLQAALEWQGREFSRHTGVPANVQVHGALDDLTDIQRTCIYRVVQEALTNCARHANATKVVVSVEAQNGGVVVLVRDNGVGFNVGASNRGGLGLLSIQERVQELEGNLQISSQPKKGTTIMVRIRAGAPA